jgi:hypothetical protein
MPEDSLAFRLLAPAAEAIAFTYPELDRAGILQLAAAWPGIPGERAAFSFTVRTV